MTEPWVTQARAESISNLDHDDVSEVEVAKGKSCLLAYGDIIVRLDQTRYHDRVLVLAW